MNLGFTTSGFNPLAVVVQGRGDIERQVVDCPLHGIVDARSGGDGVRAATGLLVATVLDQAASYSMLVEVSECLIPFMPGEKEHAATNSLEAKKARAVGFKVGQVWDQVDLALGLQEKVGDEGFLVVPKCGLVTGGL